MQVAAAAAAAAVLVWTAVVPILDSVLSAAYKSPAVSKFHLCLLLLWCCS
jgi:hypothetical protein